MPWRISPRAITSPETSAAPARLTVGSLTLSSSAVADFDLGSSSDLLAVAGTLTLNGATVNVGNSGGLTTGTYEIMSYGALTGFSASSLLVGSMPSGYSAVVVNNSVGSQIDLNIHGPKPWTGNQSSAWDTGTLNWSGSGGATTYIDGDGVMFDDTAHTGSVTLAGTVNPSIVVFTNSSLAYTLSGAGSIAGGGSLAKVAPARWW